MHFCLVDRIVEVTRPPGGDPPVGASITTLKQVSSAEEYLQDHFPTFPVLPGVLMLEAMVQAARALIESPDGLNMNDVSKPPMVLGQVRAIKYGKFLPPGSTLRVKVTLAATLPDGSLEFKGEGTRLADHGTEGATEATAVSGKFTMRTAVPVVLG
jgi:3-hydroxyacyl-[acyl-carrier-protein] dehydratase